MPLFSHNNKMAKEKTVLCETKRFLFVQQKKTTNYITITFLNAQNFFPYSTSIIKYSSTLFILNFYHIYSRQGYFANFYFHFVYRE